MGWWKRAVAAVVGRGEPGADVVTAREFRRSPRDRVMRLLLLGILLILVLILAVLYKERHDRKEAAFRAYLETPAVRERIYACLHRGEPTPSPEEQARVRAACEKAETAYEEAKVVYDEAGSVYLEVLQREGSPLEERFKAENAYEVAKTTYDEARAVFDRARAAFAEVERKPMPSLEELKEEFREKEAR